MKRANILVFIMSFVIVSFVAGQAMAETERGRMSAPGAMSEVSKAEMPMRVSKLIGKDIVNSSNESLGEVHDLILDKDGKVSYLIISHGGLLGIGDKLTPVPWDQVAAAGKFQTDARDNLVFNIAKAKLDQAPTFSSTEYMNFAARDFQKRVDQYFAGTTGP